MRHVATAPVSFGPPLDSHPIRSLVSHLVPAEDVSANLAGSRPDVW
jgi:hypothetical protein